MSVKNRDKNVINQSIIIKMAPRPGLEPGTVRLTAECSTIELSWNKSEPRVGIEPTVAFAAGLQNQSFTIQGIEAFKVWAVMDSNHRSPKRGDLQSPAIAAMRTTH